MSNFTLKLPNPACCKTNNPNHLCDKCRAAYWLSSRSYFGQTGGPVVKTQNSEESDLLPIPSLTEQIQKEAEQQQQPSRKPDSDDLLEVPSLLEMLRTESRN